MPLEFTLSDGGLEPADDLGARVPRARADRPQPHRPAPQRVTLEGSGEIDVPAGDTARVHFEGRRPGTYKVDAGAAGDAKVIVGVEPGP